MVLGADPPISSEELSIAREVAGPVEHVIFVIARADRLSRAELDEARAFTERRRAFRRDHRGDLRRVECAAIPRPKIRVELPQPPHDLTEHRRAVIDDLELALHTRAEAQRGIDEVLCSPGMSQPR